MVRERGRRGFVARIAALLVAGSALTGVAEARDRPGDFDFYVMAFSIAPSYCALEGTAKGRRQCDDPRDEDFRRTPLTVHGLWPNRAGRPANAQPESCSTEPLSGLPGDVARQLAVVMPGTVDGLHRYQWSKHGVCSGLTPEEYFRQVIGFAERANQTIGAALRERRLLGRTIEVSEILEAVAERNPALADAMVVDCRFPRLGRGRHEPGAGGAFVREIRVLIGREIERDPERDGWAGSFVPLRRVGYRANSGCPGGRGFLPDGYGR